MSSNSRIQKIIQIAFALIFVLSLAVTTLFFLKPPTIENLPFDEQMADILNREDLEDATISISVQYEGDAEPTYENEAEALIHPGSNYKLLTTAAVLSHLGPDYMYETQIFKVADNIVIRGSGDPTLTRMDLEIVGETMNEKVGQIWYDDSKFSGEKYGPGWKPDWYEAHYAIPNSALNINDNLLSIYSEPGETGTEYTTYPIENYEPIFDEVEYTEKPEDVKRGIITVIKENGEVHLTGDYVKDWAFNTSGTIKNPAEATAMIFRQILASKNLTTEDAPIKPYSGQFSLDHEEPIYVHYSPATSDLISQMLIFSRNHYAESFIRALGEEVDKTSALGSQEKGTKVLEEFLITAGLNKDQMQLFDGSGLSPNNRFSAKNMITLLSYISDQEWADTFWNSLPQPGLEGTLINRFKDLPLNGIVHAKTGSHENSNSLSGRIERPHTPGILFSIHIYQHPFTPQEAKTEILPLIDQLVSAIDQEF